MALNYDDIKQCVSALHPAQAMEVAKIAQIAVKAAQKEGKWDVAVDPSGKVAVGGLSDVPNILWLGDSFSRAGDVTECPSGTAPITGTITGLSVQGHEIGACTLPNGTVRTLTYNAAAQTLKFGTGTPVALTRSGYILVPDAVANTGVYVSVRIPDLPATNGSLTTTSSTNRPDTGRTMLSCTAWFDLFNSARNNVINLSGGGQTMRSALTTVQYARSVYSYCAVVLALGVNDVTQCLAYADPLAEMQSRWTALVDVVQSGGAPVFSLLLPANNQTESTAYLELVDKFNRWLSRLSRPGLVVVDAWSCMASADPAATAGRSGYINPDDLHPLAPAVQLAMYRLWLAVDRYGLPASDPFVAYPRGIASAANPGGNLITNAWQFGSSGTVSAPATGVCSNNMTLSVGGVALSSLAGSKVASDPTDGIDSPWMTQTISSSTDNSFSSLTLTLPGTVAPQAGDLVELIAEVRVNGDLLCTDFRTQAAGSFGGVNPFLRSMIPDLTHLATSTPMPISQYQGVLRSAPFIWPAGGVPGSTQITTYARNGTSGAVAAVRRVGFRRVVG